MQRHTTISLCVVLILLSAAQAAELEDFCKKMHYCPDVKNAAFLIHAEEESILKCKCCPTNAISAKCVDAPTRCTSKFYNCEQKYADMNTLCKCCNLENSQDCVNADPLCPADIVDTDPYCTTCRAGKCTECRNGRDATGKCSSCLVPNCATCAPTNTSACADCIAKYELTEDNQCKPDGAVGIQSSYMMLAVVAFAVLMLIHAV